MVYRFIESGSLPSLKIGGSRRIVVADLERFVQRLREESGSGVGA
ncbi:MAG: helix-turn-helix domain-containing protein [Chloroflexota bacterium]|nr:helix-turn-helix domain-containing protein [Chloroflexota bacterium]